MAASTRALSATLFRAPAGGRAAAADSLLVLAHARACASPPFSPSPPRRRKNFKQLVAEQLVTIKTKRGFQKLEWQKLRERNEVLDCRVYARAAAWIAGADRWSDEKWRDLEDQVGQAPASIFEGEAMMGDAGVLAQQSPTGARRRSNWLGVQNKGWLR